ncbi:UNVERIFIED_ORG: hypothetical protein J2Y81_004976 [Paraburkholderia sediminicola]|nr:hypothetical protein [Paraburkholderia sediminicola]
MIFNWFKWGIDRLARYTPNAFLPRYGVYMTRGKIAVHDWAEFYLTLRFIFSALLATVLSKSWWLVGIVFIIQTGSLVYLLKIVFPLGSRELKDPARSLFFALGHYIEIGFSMGYVYWNVNSMTVRDISISKSVYFSFVTMTTIGFGDIVPNSDLARWLVVVQSIVGLFMLATVIGLFLSLSTSNQNR